MFRCIFGNFKVLQKLIGRLFKHFVNSGYLFLGKGKLSKSSATNVFGNISFASNSKGFRFKYLAEKYLSTLRDKYSNLLHLLTFENIHAKTLIMDGNLIAEGSFNWLCAARDELYFSHKHEATFMLEGPEAAKQIRAFYQTPVGKELIKKFGSSKIVIKSQEENYAHTQKVDAATRIKLRNQYFINQKANVTKDLWINFPFWYQSADYTRTSLIYGKFFEIMASNRPDKKGYCLRINGDYLYKGKHILYFPTIPKAKEAAYNIWLQMYE